MSLRNPWSNTESCYAIAKMKIKRIYSNSRGVLAILYATDVWELYYQFAIKVLGIRARAF